MSDLPSDQVLRFSTEMNVVREKEVFSPIDNLSIHIVGILGAKWWVSYNISRPDVNTVEGNGFTHQQDIQT
jgi:hypothetical protein